MLAQRLMMSGGGEIVWPDVFPSEEPENYVLITTLAASQTWEAPESGYFRVEVHGASGRGGSRKILYDDNYDNTYYASGGGGKGGGYSCSDVTLNKGDTIDFVSGAVGTGTTSVVFNSTTGETYDTISITSGANGGNGSGTGTTNITMTAGAAGTSGGVASGGNVANKDGSSGTKGATGSEVFASHTATVLGGTGGAPGEAAGNAGGDGAGYESGSYTSPGPGGPGLIKIYRGDTNIVGGQVGNVTTSPKPGVTYTDGLDGLSAEDVSKIAGYISDDSDITNSTKTVCIDDGTIRRRIRVGDQVSLDFNGTAYPFEIVGFNHDALTDGEAYGLPTTTGKAGMTFGMHNVTPDSYPMAASDSNVLGWEGVRMRSSTMPLMKSYLPSEWQAVIKPVDKLTGVGGSGATETETTSDECFLYSEVEVFGTATNSVAGEGSQYAYYRAGGSTTKTGIESSGGGYWRLRSPDSESSDAYCYVSSSGTQQSVLKATYGMRVSFAFCV